MSKVKIIFLSVFFIAFSAQAGYVRKLKEPDFFIPEGQGMHVQEKLPPISISEKKMTVKDEIKKENLTEIPEYKKKYDNYLEDINIFVKTNKMPENDVLESDLKAMESGEIFEVTQNVSQEAKNKEEETFYNLLKDIMEN